MKKYLGGYANVDLNSDTIYNDLLNLKNVDKTILLYDTNETKPYFIDTIVYDTDTIIITKGGKTITIADDNTITSSGDIQPKEKKLYDCTFYVSDMYVHFITSNIYKFETNTEYQVNDDDYTTCVLTGELLDSLKQLLRDNINRNFSCYINSDNLANLDTRASIVVEVSGTQQFQLNISGDVLTTDSLGYEDYIYLKIFEI